MTISANRYNLLLHRIKEGCKTAARQKKHASASGSSTAVGATTTRLSHRSHHVRQESTATLLQFVVVVIRLKHITVLIAGIANIVSIDIHVFGNQQRSEPSEQLSNHTSGLSKDEGNKVFEVREYEVGMDLGWVGLQWQNFVSDMVGLRQVRHNPGQVVNPDSAGSDGVTQAPALLGEEMLMDFHDVTQSAMTVIPAPVPALALDFYADPLSHELRTYDTNIFNDLSSLALPDFNMELGHTRGFSNEANAHESISLLDEYPPFNMDHFLPSFDPLAFDFATYNDPGATSGGPLISESPPSSLPILPMPQPSPPPSMSPPQPDIPALPNRKRGRKEVDETNIITGSRPRVKVAQDTWIPKHDDECSDECRVYTPMEVDPPWETENDKRSNAAYCPSPMDVEMTSPRDEESLKASDMQHSVQAHPVPSPLRMQHEWESWDLGPLENQRSNYKKKLEILRHTNQPLFPLQFRHIPWPIFRSGSSNLEVNTPVIQHFIFGQTRSTLSTDESVKLAKRNLKFFHSDKFTSTIERVIPIHREWARQTAEINNTLES
ncbi:hypothetical protein B0H13DRAFT_1852460 [Mycena leptocephala]|nr:hypothetical protein B0H13DRAFT_1852460 [Mycena leptocephala]